jgi:hypothetical protein
LDHRHLPLSFQRHPAIVVVLAFGHAVTQNESLADTRRNVFAQHQNIVCTPE